jgi:hypothetical protein
MSDGLVLDRVTIRFGGLTAVSELTCAWTAGNCWA